MPLRLIQLQSGAEFMAYGPGPEEGGVEIVQDFGAYPAEYAAIRQRVGIMHLPQRGLIELRGGDRADFLHRLITHDVNNLPPGQGRRAMQLNTKGRIVADLVVLQSTDRLLIDTDRLDTTALLALLDSKLFSEDVQLRDASDEVTHLALHGPAAVALLHAVTGKNLADLKLLEHRELPFGEHVGTVYRRDDAGATGLHLLLPSAAAAAVYQALLDAAGFVPGAEADPDEDYARQRRQGLRGRPVGWLAYNTARIEAGTPIFHIDFGHDSIPGETGLLDETVSFTKGCYLGQEIVARMKNLGHPKRMLVGIRFEGDALPVAGAQVFEQADTPTRPGTAIGGITSSTLSPLLGQVVIAFAVLKWGKHQPGTAVLAGAEGQLVQGRVQGLRFLPGS